MIDRDPMVGDVVVARHVFGAEDFKAFAALSGDRNPLHHDPVYAARTAIGTPIVPALLAASPLSAAAGMALPGHRSLVLGVEVRALEPVFYEQEVVYSCRVMAVSEATGVLDLRAIALQAGRVVIEGRLRVRVRDDVAKGDGPAPSWGALRSAADPRRALITGAGGSVGAACARALAGRGWQLTLQHRRGDSRAAALAAELGAAPQVEHLPGDLADPEDRAALAAGLARAPVDAVVHAASPPVEAPSADLHAVSYAALRALVDAVLPHMLEGQEGAVVTIGSEAVRTTPPGWEDYVAAKVAAAKLTETIGRRHGAHGISAAVVNPTYVTGEFSAAYRSDADAALMPEEVAEVVAELLADPGGGPSELWLRPGVTERTPSVTPVAESMAPVAAAGEPEAAASQAMQVPAGEGEVERIVRAVLGLEPSVGLADAGLGRTENWTSLAQIEILLALEQELGITFSSAELSAAPSLSDLKDLVARKRA
ncbi:MAG TPA: SDR family NAD(P)-dependent oxidoreductase [Solirubrobacterales bacterium]|nr:SDR family NAD(P)-dependent oxidoreductase [Solirubrobacterales bacterium]